MIHFFAISTAFLKFKIDWFLSGLIFLFGFWLCLKSVIILDSDEQCRKSSDSAFDAVSTSEVEKKVSDYNFLLQVEEIEMGIFFCYWWVISIQPID